jgi:glycine cleavage system H lipoate-binding protein
MVPILVLLTFAVSIGGYSIYSWLQKRREIERAVDASTHPVPEGCVWFPGHTWMLPTADRRGRLGIDAFAGRLLGRVDEIRLPLEGEQVKRGGKLFSVRQGERWAEIKSPVAGTVTTINDAVRNLSFNAGTGISSYWLCEIEQADLAAALEGGVRPESLRSWLAGEVQRIMGALTPSKGLQEGLGAMLPDGGTLVDGLLETVDDRTWERATQVLFEK